MFKYLNKGVSTPIAISIIILIAVIVGGGVLVYQYWWLPKEEAKNIECTMEAKLCPDGSYVSRTGPSCEFAECPTRSDETADWQTYRNEEYGFELEYPEGSDIAPFSERSTGGDSNGLTIRSGIGFFSITHSVFGTLKEQEVDNFKNGNFQSFPCLYTYEERERKTIKTDNVYILKCGGIGVDHPNRASISLSASFERKGKIWTISLMQDWGTYKEGIMIPTEITKLFDTIVSTLIFF